MARPGTRPTSNKTNYQSQPSIPASQKQGAEEQNYINDKINNSGLNEAWTSVVSFNDTYYPDPYTMTGPIEYTIDGTNAGIGNKRKDTITGDGNTITFTGFTIRDSTLVPTSNVVTTVAAKVYTIVFERVGAISEVYLWENNATSTGGGTAETTTYEDSGLTSGNLVADKTNVQEAEAETRAWVNSPGKALGTFTGAMAFNTQGQYTDYTLAGDLELTATNIELFNMQVVRISTPGGYNVTFGSGIDKLITPFENPLPIGDYWFYMASFVAPGGVGNGIHVSIPEVQIAKLPQLTTPILTDVIGIITSTTELDITFTNTNGGNEDQNQVYYKLSSSSTWIAGIVIATSGATGTQTGLTAGGTYDIKIVAEGSIIYSNSPDSNIVQGVVLYSPYAVEAETNLGAFIQSDSNNPDYLAINNYTMDIFIKSKNEDISGIILSYGDGVNGPLMYCQHIKSSHATLANKIRFIFNNAATGATHFIIADSSLPVSREEYHHIALTINTTTETAILYIDGIADTSAAITFTPGFSQSDDIANRLTICDRPDVTTAEWAGTMKYLNIWSEEMSAANVLTLSKGPNDLTVHPSWANNKLSMKFENNYTNSGNGTATTFTNTSTLFTTDTPLPTP